jgi:hypothetical protein
MNCERGCKLKLNNCPGRLHIGICTKVAEGDADYADLAHQLATRPELPPLWKQATNFITSAVEHVAAGMPTVSDEERNRRLDVCRSCPRFIADQERCSVCGCYMATKASWDQVQCPEGRW